MVIEWDKNAKNDLKEYVKLSKTSTAKEYAKKLSTYVRNLAEYPNLGKIQYIYNNSEIRQLLFKMHRIYYRIKDNKIIIIAVLHTNVDIAKITQYLKGLTY